MPSIWSRQTLPIALAFFILTGWFTLRSLSSSPELAFVSDSSADYADGPPAAFDALGAPARPVSHPKKPTFEAEPFLSTPPDPEALYRALVPGLQALVNRPIASYRDSLALETKRCPITHRQSNPDQVKGDGRWWATATVAELGAARAKLATQVVEAFGFTAELDGPRGEQPVSMKSSLSAAAWKELFGMGGNGGRGLVFTAGK